jgi:hypothetical protein
MPPCLHLSVTAAPPVLRQSSSRPSRAFSVHRRHLWPRPNLKFKKPNHHHLTVSPPSIVAAALEDHTAPHGPHSSPSPSIAQLSLSCSE